jgi:hypothetical protein
MACVGLGCGGGGGDLDASLPDAVETVCPVPEGHSRILTRMRFLPSDQGFDLDGDEQIDNMLGRIPQSALDSIHQGLDDSIEVGEWLQVLHIEDWTSPPTPTDQSIRCHIFSGVDADAPPDPSNNLGGEGRFYIRDDEFDLNCNSATEADEAEIVDRLLVATRSEWAFAINQGVGTMQIKHATLEHAFEADYFNATGRFGGMTTLCSLSALPFPGDTPGTVLDGFVNDPIVAEAISVDMDIDGDGLEQVIGDGVTILECIDGDGTTVIPGRDCPCHPAIADAYSIATQIDSVPAEIVAVR